MSTDPAPHRPGSVPEVFLVFLRLGLTSFGGPVAHLAYFREAFVVRRRWLTEQAYADLVALCQFLPGPASSQVGMAVGLRRAGPLGLLAAWVGFTLPSAILMVAFGYGVATWGGSWGGGWLLGLKAAAVAVVANAVLGMGRSLTPDLPRLALAALTMVMVLLLPGSLTQLGLIVAGAVVGSLWLQGLTGRVASGTGTGTGTTGQPADARGLSGPVAILMLALFAGLLVVLPLWAAGGSVLAALVEACYRAGALIFGGGHVVLPLLDGAVVQPGLVDQETFLAGYGAAQAVPGPLISFAGYLGVVSLEGAGAAGLLGAGLALVAISLPGALLVMGVLPFWEQVRRWGRARAALAGINAVVVGILAAALYDPVITQGVTSAGTLFLAVLGWLALLWGRVPAWALVITAGVAGHLLL